MAGGALELGVQVGLRQDAAGRWTEMADIGTWVGVHVGGWQENAEDRASGLPTRCGRGSRRPAARSASGRRASSLTLIGRHGFGA